MLFYFLTGISFSSRFFRRFFHLPIRFLHRYDPRSRTLTLQTLFLFLLGSSSSNFSEKFLELARLKIVDFQTLKVRLFGNLQFFPFSTRYLRFERPFQLLFYFLLDIFNSGFFLWLPNFESHILGFCWLSNFESQIFFVPIGIYVIMTLNAEQILAMFPHPTLTKIVGEPTL